MFITIGPSHSVLVVAGSKRVTPASSPAAPASRVRRSRHLRSTLAAAPGLRAHALVTKQLKLTIYSDAMSYSGAQGNKGAVGVRMKLFDSTVCFVCGHLAAHQLNIAGRNADASSITTKLLFKNDDAATT